MNRSDLGAKVIAPGRVQFRVWSPKRKRVELRVIAPFYSIIPMEETNGYHEATVDARLGARYYYLLDGIQRPDPASRYQPEGVHGASEVVDAEFAWHDGAWKGV